MESNEFLAKALRESRQKAKRSQEYMALEMEIARKTVQNWESGVSEPSVRQAIEWFRVLQISPMPYLFQYVYPDFEGISRTDGDQTLRKALLAMVEGLPEECVRQLLFLFYGDHGSSPMAVMQMVTAHLQTTMRDRVTAGTVILKNYEIAEKKGILSAPNHIQPDKGFLKNAIERGEQAAIDDAESYV